MREALRVRGLASLRGVRFAPMLAVVLLSLVVEECYPFSHFPMYSKFHDHTWYLYLSDGHDRPLATRERFVLATATLKKIHSANLRSAGAAGAPPGAPLERAAGLVTLRLVAERALAPPPASLRLWRVDLYRRGREIVRERSFVAELAQP